MADTEELELRVIDLEAARDEAETRIARLEMAILAAGGALLSVVDAEAPAEPRNQLRLLSP